MNVCADDWRAEMSTIANNDLLTLYDFIGRIIGRIMKKNEIQRRIQKLATERP